MIDLQPLQVLLIVGEAAAASVLLPPLAWLAARTYRRRAAGRRLVWVTAFAMLLALPLLALVAPSLAVIPLPAPPSTLPAAPAAAVAAEPGRGGFSWTDLIPVAGAVWLAGLVKLGAEHLVAGVRLELMRHRATPWGLPTPVPVRGCDLLLSEDCPGPMTWGVLRPVIMLPDAALDWTPERLQTVLRHELAHVRRRDGLAQALAVIACALYWPNPLVWGAARALRREAELAADDAVIAAGVRPSDYAGQLLDLAAEWRERRLTPTGLAMAAPPALSQRVQSILSTDAIRTGATAMDTFKLVLLGGAATAALTLARPSVAEVPAPDAGLAPQHVELTPADGQPPPSATQHLEVRPAAPPGATKSVHNRDQIDRFTVAAADRPAAAARPNTAADSETRLAQDLRAAPPVAPVEVQPAPPEPPAALAPPAPPVPSAPPAPPQFGGGPPVWLPNPAGRPTGPKVGFGARLTPEQRADLDRKLAAIGPAIDKAIADAHIDETVQKALSAQDAKTREEVAKQLQQIGPRIQQSIANAHIQELVQQRLAEIQPQIEAAMARAREQSRQGAERAAQAEERNAERLEEQARRARERAQRNRERLAEPQPQPQPPRN